MKSWLFNTGSLVVLLGIFLVFLSFPKEKTEFFVGGLIGPIPFGFASSQKWLKIGIILTIISVLIFLFSFSNKIP